MACVQAAWLVLQVIARLQSGLQVTLLKIKTLGHVLCAVVIYILWWHKPQMVLEPLALDGDWVGPLCTYMYMSSQVSGQRKESKGPLSNTISQPEMSSVAFFPRTPCDHPIVTIKECHDIGTDQRPDSTLTTAGQDLGLLPTHDPDPCASPEHEEVAVLCGSFRLRPTPHDSTKRLQGDQRTEFPDESQESESGRQLRWCLAAEAICKYPAIRRRFTQVAHKFEEKSTICLQEA